MLLIKNAMNLLVADEIVAKICVRLRRCGNRWRFLLLFLQLEEIEILSLSILQHNRHTP